MTNKEEQYSRPGCCWLIVGKSENHAVILAHHTCCRKEAGFIAAQKARLGELAGTTRKKEVNLPKARFCKLPNCPSTVENLLNENRQTSQFDL